MKCPTEATKGRRSYFSSWFQGNKGMAARSPSMVVRVCCMTYYILADKQEETLGWDQADYNLWPHPCSSVSAN